MEKCNGKLYTNVAGYQFVCVKKRKITVVSLDNNAVKTYKRNSKMYKMILKEIESNTPTIQDERKIPELKSFFAWACFWCKR